MPHTLYPQWVHAAMEEMSMQYHKANEQRHSDPYQRGFADAIDVCQKIFMHHFQNADSDWIPIKDGGFQDNERVLITNGKEIWEDIIFKDYDNGKYVFYFECTDPDIVTHWQPLPNPPEKAA